MKKIFGLLMMLLASGCKNYQQAVHTVALVTPRTFHGRIIIFFDQDTSIGDIRLIGHKHYFFVKQDGIFFTKLSLGEGIIEDYQESNGKLERVYYSSPMRISSVADTSYQVIGGSYRGIDHANNGRESKLIRFLPFQAGIAKSLKEEWEIGDATVDSIYSTILHR